MSTFDRKPVHFLLTSVNSLEYTKNETVWFIVMCGTIWQCWSFKGRMLRTSKISPQGMLMLQINFGIIPILPLATEL